HRAPCCVKATTPSWAQVKKATVAGPSSCWRFSSFPSRNTPLCVPIKSSDILSLLYSAVAPAGHVGHDGVNQYTPHTLAAALSGEVLAAIVNLTCNGLTVA